MKSKYIPLAILSICSFQVFAMQPDSTLTTPDSIHKDTIPVRIDSIQKTTTNIETIEKKSSLAVALGISASTNGFGINIIANLNRYFDIRLGYEHVDMTFNNAFTYQQAGRDLNCSPNWKTGGFSALVDINFLKGIYVSLGVIQTQMNLGINIKSKDPVKLGDIYFSPDELGEMVMTFKPDRKLAPYIGLGLGRQISLKHRISFSFEFGAYFMKSYLLDVEGSKIFEANGDPANQASIDYVNDQLKNMTWSGVFPVLKLSLAYKIWKK